MSKRIFLFLLIAFSTKSFSQINFEKGYFIKNSEEKIECLIKNVDWKNNPTEFSYKFSENDSQKTSTLSEVKEFGIYNQSKYIKFAVSIDKSSALINKLDKNGNPEFENETLFLELLVDGKADLFSYVSSNLIRYFYRTDESIPNQLIYKKYLTHSEEIGRDNSADKTIATNNGFRQQLWTDLICSGITLNKVENLDYNKRDLTKFFINYNTCVNVDYINYGSAKNKSVFHIGIRPRLNSASLSFENSANNNRDIDFGNHLNFGLGIELEHVLPYNKNKWSLVFEPTFQNYKAKASRDSGNLYNGTLNATVNYSSIELPLSLRHYFFLNRQSKLFVSLAYVYDLDIGGSDVKFESATGLDLGTLDVNSSNSYSIGLGFKHKDQYSLEIRYLPRNIITDYAAWSSKYRNISFIFGYNFF